MVRDDALKLSRKSDTTAAILATNLERIGIRDAITAMLLRHTNDWVTRKHYIKPPSIEAVSAMRRLSETLRSLTTATRGASL
jgi:hypothetical protein